MLVFSTLGCHISVHFIQIDSNDEIELSLAEKDAEIARLNRALALKEQEQATSAQYDRLDDRFGNYYPPGGMFPWHPWMPYPAPTFPPPPRQDPMSKAIESKLSASHQSPDSPLGPPIPEPCAAKLKSWFWSIPSTKEINSALKECCRPRNCEALKPILVNPELQRSFNQDDMSKDSALKYIAATLPTAAQPFAQMWAELI